MTWKDPWLLLGQLGLAPVALALPVAGWPAAARLAARTMALLRPSAVAGEAGHIARVAAGRVADPKAVALGVRASRLERALQYARSLWPGGWRTKVELAGREHLDAALASGRGAVLWVAPFVQSYLLAKKALDDAGYAVFHLSHEGHGPAWSWFGRRVVNRLRVRAEERHLAERIVIRPGTRLAALRELERRLRGGALVSISAGPFARRMLERPFLSGRLSHPTGPPVLALAARAPLLPVFARRNGRGVLEVTVDAPLQPDAGLGRAANVARMVEGYAERMEARALESPTHFIWRFVLPEGAP